LAFGRCRAPPDPEASDIDRDAMVTDLFARLAARAAPQADGG